MEANINLWRHQMPHVLCGDIRNMIEHKVEAVLDLVHTAMCVPFGVPYFVIDSLVVPGRVKTCRLRMTT